MKRVVLFDHDGVLVDTERWYFKAGERALAEVGVTLDETRYLQDMDQGLGTWAQARAAGVDERTIARCREVRDAHYREYLRSEEIEIDGVVEALAELAPYARMAVVTTAKRADFELIHRDRRITRYMDVVLCREDYVRAKPDPEPYRKALALLGVAPSEALVVEDSSRGLRSAVAAGVDCALVDNAFTRPRDVAPAKFRIQRLAELKGILLAAT